jgi:hypothetical protein
MNSGIMLRNSDCNVETFCPADRPDLIKRLSAVNYGHVNYDTINWHDFDCVSILINGDSIVGFSSVFRRKEFYDDGECRILNRYWEDSALRRPGRELARPHLIMMVKQQLSFAKRVGYTKAFISREKNPKVFAELINKIAQATDTLWDIHDTKVAVCSPKSPKCWQYKGYTKL